MDVTYEIDIVNFESLRVEGLIECLNQPAIDPADAIDSFLEGSETPLILESVENDDDKTKVIKGRKLLLGFNSTDPSSFGTGTLLGNNVDSFADGVEDDFRVQVNLVGTSASSIPFVGNLVLDDNTEAFQPRPNPVQLYAGEGLGSLKDVELRDLDGEIPVGHYRIIDYIYFCLSRIRTGFNIYVAMNLFERIRMRADTSVRFNLTATNVFRISYDLLGFLEIGDEIEITGSVTNDGTYTITNITPIPTTWIDIEVSTSTFTTQTSDIYIFRTGGHTFSDIYLDATTFENDVNTRLNCFEVLNMILDAYGCFITYDCGGWYIIRWDEYDVITTGATTLRFANYALGEFFQYTTIDVDKIIAADYDPLYEGYRLSQDNAVKRFQRKAKSVKHIYKYETPKEIPCNSAFLRGELSATQPVDPLQRNYDYECWAMHKGLPPITNNGTSYIRVVTDAAGYETDRYVLFPVQPDNSSSYYIESEPIYVNQYDKINISCDIKHDGQVETAATGFSYVVMIVKLFGDDSTYYRLDGGALNRDGGTWVVSDVTFFTGVNSSIDRIFRKSN